MTKPWSLTPEQQEQADRLTDRVHSRASSLTQAAEAVERSVTRQGDATAVDLLAACEAAGLPVEGDYRISIVPNLFLLIGQSEAVCDVFDLLRQRQVVELVPCSMLAWMVDGNPIIPDWPIAKRPPKEGYKKPHWLPWRFILATESVDADTEP